MGRGEPPPTISLVRSRRSLWRGRFGHGRAGNDDNFGRSRAGNRNANNGGRGRAGNRNRNHFGRRGFNGGKVGFLLAGRNGDQREAQGSDGSDFTHSSPLKVGAGWAVQGNAAGG